MTRPLRVPAVSSRKIDVFSAVAYEPAIVSSLHIVYNEERPHEALGQKRPATIYRPSPRRDCSWLVRGWSELGTERS